MEPQELGISSYIPAQVHAEQIPAAIRPGLTEEEAAEKSERQSAREITLYPRDVFTGKLGGIVRLDVAVAVLQPHETGEHGGEAQSNAEDDSVAYSCRQNWLNGGRHGGWRINDRD